MKIQLISVEFYDKRSNKTEYERWFDGSIYFETKKEFQEYRQRYRSIFSSNLKEKYQYINLVKEEEYGQK